MTPARPPARSLYATAVLAISAGAFLPVPSMAQAEPDLVTINAPPAPRFESVPHARQGFVWAPGYWNWDGQRHVWSAGHWEAERSGAVYRRPEWVRDGQRWRLNQGGWATLRPARVHDARLAPPPPRHELLPPPRSGYVWSPGHWELRGPRHGWVAGAWIAERPGYVYRPAAWSQRGGRWYFEPGRWDGHGDRNRHDRDQDGGPNRRGVHPDHPLRN